MSEKNNRIKPKENQEIQNINENQEIQDDIQKNEENLTNSKPFNTENIVCGLGADQDQACYVSLFYSVDLFCI